MMRYLLNTIINITLKIALSSVIAVRIQASKSRHFQEMTDNKY